MVGGYNLNNVIHIMLHGGIYIKKEGVLGMKKIVVFILAVVILIAALSGCDKQSDPNSGNNKNYVESTTRNEPKEESVESTTRNEPKEESVVEISSEDDLRNIERNPKGSYILTNDIDLSQNSNWEPLCSYSNPFTGTLDGNGYCIKSINVDVKHEKTISDSQYAGLFRCVSGATIKNLGIVGGTISISSATSGGRAGALAGDSTPKRDGANIKLTEVSNCWINATVESNEIEDDNPYHGCYIYVGAFFGSGCANFTNCYNLGKVSAAKTYEDQIIGGFIGSPTTYEQCPMTIKSCYSFGTLSVRHGWPGGFIGGNMGGNHVDIIDSYYYKDTAKNNQAANSYKDTDFTSVKGLTGDELKSKSSLNWFDFNEDWAISTDKNDGYPYLRVQKTVN